MVWKLPGPFIEELIVSRCFSNPKFGVTKNRHLESSTIFVSAKIYSHLSHEKNPGTFHYTGWLKAILMVYEIIPT